MKVIESVIDTGKLNFFIDEIYKEKEFNANIRLMMNKQTAKALSTEYKRLNAGSDWSYYYMGIKILFDDEVGSGEVMIMAPFC